jgi:multiple sugar transport system substrate-binding protein
MRRRLTLAAAWLAAVGALAACRPPPAGSLSFMLFGEPAEQRAYRDLVEAFHARQSAVRVRLQPIPEQREYRRRLGADFAAGIPPDVMLLNYRRFADLAARGVLEPLEPYLRQSTVLREADFFPEAIAAFRWQGRLMAIPQNVSSLVVYYNRDLFRAAGVPEPADDWTWADFLSAARRLTRDTDGDGRPEQYGLGIEASLTRAAPFIWQNGGELVDDPDRPLLLTVAEAPSVQALRWFCELQTRHRVVPDAAGEKAEDSETRFVNGRAAMFLNSRRGVPNYRQLRGFDWDVAPLPRGKRRAGVLHADAYFVARACADKAAAWRFIEFANSPEGQRLVAASGRTVPSLRAVARSPVFLESNLPPRRSRVFLDTIPHLRAFPIHRHWIDVEEVVTDEIERAFYGRAELADALIAATERTGELLLQP